MMFNERIPDKFIDDTAHIYLNLVKNNYFESKKYSFESKKYSFENYLRYRWGFQNILDNRMLGRDK